MTRVLATPGGRLAAAALTGAALWPAYGWLALLAAGVIALASFAPEVRLEAFSVMAVGMFVGQVWPQAVAAGVSWRPLVFTALWAGAVLLWSRRPICKGRAVLLVHAGTVALVAGLAFANVTGVRVIGSAIAILTLAVQMLWRTS